MSESIRSSVREVEFETAEALLAHLQLQGRHFPRLFLCVLLQREGAVPLVTAIEHQLYAPGTSANDDFQMAMLKWETLPYAVVSVPRKDRAAVERVLGSQRVPWRLNEGEPHLWTDPARKNPDGTQVFVHGAWRDTDIARSAKFPGAICFPLSGPNVVTVEFAPAEPGPHVAGVLLQPGQKWQAPPSAGANRQQRRRDQRKGNS